MLPLAWHSPARNGNATGNMNSGQARWYGVRTFIRVALGGGRLA
jgi:hypothetical protein